MLKWGWQRPTSPLHCFLEHVLVELTAVLCVVLPLTRSPLSPDSGYAIAVVVSAVVYFSFYVIALCWILVFDWWRCVCVGGVEVWVWVGEDVIVTPWSIPTQVLYSLCFQADC